MYYDIWFGMKEEQEVSTRKMKRDRKNKPRKKNE